MEKSQTIKILTKNLIKKANEDILHDTEISNEFATAKTSYNKFVKNIKDDLRIQ